MRWSRLKVQDFGSCCCGVLMVVVVGSMHEWKLQSAKMIWFLMESGWMNYCCTFWSFMSMTHVAHNFLFNISTPNKFSFNLNRWQNHMHMSALEVNAFFGCRFCELLLIILWQIISFSAMFFSSHFQTRSLRNKMSNLWVWKYLMCVIFSLIDSSCSSTKQTKLHLKCSRETLKHSIVMLKCCCWWTLTADRLINMSNFLLDQLHSLSMIKQLITNWT